MRGRQGFEWDGCRFIEYRDLQALTPSEKYRVNAMLPKYAAVNGNRGPEIRCCTGIHV